MWPLILAAGGLAAYLFGSKPKATGPTVLADTTAKLGQPIGTQNWPAPASGRIYRVTHWQTPNLRTVLVLGGLWAAQPSAPNTFWLVQNSGSGWTVVSSSQTDATGKLDFSTLQQSFPT